MPETPLRPLLSKRSLIPPTHCRPQLLQSQDLVAEEEDLRTALAAKLAEELAALGAAWRDRTSPLKRLVWLAGMDHPPSLTHGHLDCICIFYILSCCFCLPRIIKSEQIGQKHKRSKTTRSKRGQSGQRAGSSQKQSNALKSCKK